MSGAGGGGGAEAPVRAGHLRKLKTMKKKFFVLRADTPDCSARLEYYESEKKYKSGAAPRRVIPLKSCYNITRRLDLKQKHVIALFTKEEQFCVVAENEQDLHGWLAAILKLHRNDEASKELLHPIQHVWQVNVQKKGLGATKNIQGLYNLCLTDKTLTLVKIKSQNNVISDLGIPERVEFSLKNIRRCGDSECFFYMEVGRQTATGAGELWMHSDDSNIAQSMHSTIYHAMRNCAKETENERDHIVIPKRSDSDGATLPTRRQSYSDPKGRAGLANDAEKIRSRCDSMPSRPSNTFEVERPPQRHTELDSGDVSRDEPDSVEWHRTPRIPEEPDLCDSAIKELMSSSFRSSLVHSRTSSIGVEEADSCQLPDGYVPMAPHGSHSPAPPLPSASSGSVCSGTPSTDPRFSEYQLEPAMSHIVDCERPPRAYSVGSRPAPRADPPRHRAYSVGASRRPPPPRAHAVCSAPQLPRASAEDLMELDFSNNSPAAKVVVSQTPPAVGFAEPRVEPRLVDEYVDMSPRNAGYVEMRPGEGRVPPPAPTPALTPATNTSTPDGYVEMNYGRAATRPIAIAAPRAAPPAVASSPDERRKRNGREARTPLGSQTIFPLSLDSPASPPELDTTAVTSPDERRKRNGRDNRKPLASQTIFPLSLDSPVLPPELDTTDDFEDEHELLETHHPLTTVREISEDGRKSPEVSCSPSYVKLAYSKPIAAPNKTPEAADELSCNPLATKTLAREPEKADPSTCATVVLAGTGATLARFAVPPAGSGVSAGAAPLNYASLDLEPCGPPAPPAPRTYTQIDFARSEKLQADNN